MKKLIIPLFAIALLLPWTVTAASDDAVLKVSVLKYEPIPAEPGKYVTVYIDVENTGNADAKDAVLQIVPEFPFFIDESAATKDIGILGSQRDYVASFKIRVSPDAVEGENTLKVRYTKDGIQWVDANLDIDVQSSGADIQVMSATTEPVELVPGQTGMLRVRVKNVASSFLTDIKLKLDLTDTTTTTYPFIVVGSSTEQRIGQLDSGESSEFVYEIKPYPDAASQLYKIPITLSYKDSLDNSYTKSDILGIIVNSEPELTVSIDDLRSDGTIILKVINKGLTDVKFLTMQVEPGDNYEILSSSNTYYVGELASDDFDTTDFTIAFTGKDVTIPVKLTYRDANNNQYEKTFNLAANPQETNTNSGGSGTAIIIIIVVVVLIVGFIVYRRMKKKK